VFWPADVEGSASRPGTGRWPKRRLSIPLNHRQYSSLPVHGRANHVGQQRWEEIGQHGHAVATEHRLRVELHTGEAGSAQGMHRRVGRIAGHRDRSVRRGERVGLGGGGEAGVEADPPAHAEEMYEPEVFGRTATAMIEVR